MLHDGKRRSDDYEVRYNGRTVGRIYRMRSTGRELWLWTQIGIRAPSHGPNGGLRLPGGGADMAARASRSAAEELDAVG